MNKYMGVPCPVCQQVFTEADDIVVCPECGAPHHRACYKEQGNCALAQQHGKGDGWKSPLQASPVPSTAPVQPVLPAGTLPAQPQAPAPAGAPDYRNNYRQGAADSQGGFAGEQAPRATPLRIDIDDSIDDVPVKELAQFVGENTFYYLPRFKLFSTSKQPISMNLSAVIFGFFYYFNRKMYKIGAAMLGLFCLTVIPIFLLMFRTFPEFYTYFTIQGAAMPDLSAYTGLTTAFMVMRYIYMAACLFCGMFANFFYYKHTMNSIHHLKEEYRGKPEGDYAQALAIHGRTNKLLVVAIGITFFVLMNIYSGILLTYHHIL